MSRVSRVLSIIQEKGVDNYSKIYDSYINIKKDFNNTVNKNKMDVNIPTMISKYNGIIDFYVKNKNNFRDDYYQSLRLNYYDTVDGATKSKVVDIVNSNTPRSYDDASKSDSDAVEMIRSAVKDKIGNYKQYNMDIKYITGTNTFQVDYLENLNNIDDFKVVNKINKVMTDVELKNFIKDKFSDIKSISNAYA